MLVSVTSRAALKRCCALTPMNTTENLDRSRQLSHFKICLIDIIPPSILASTSPHSRISSACSIKAGSTISNPNLYCVASLRVSAINLLLTPKMPISVSASANFGSGQMTKFDKPLWHVNGRLQTGSLIKQPLKERHLKPS